MSGGWLAGVLAVPVTVLTAGRTTSVYGVNEPDWDHPAEQDCLGWVQPGPGGEEADWSGGRDQQTSDAVAWLPAGVAITGRDRVVVVGETFEVVGPPERRLSPWTGAEHHVRAVLRRLAGPNVEPEEPEEPEEPAEPEGVAAG